MNKTQFNREAARIISDTKSGLNGMDDRQVRIKAIKDLTETYTAANGKRPDNDILERLTDCILHEELTDPDVYKIAHNEYPFMSEHQFDLRRGRELNEGLVENHGTDGKNHAKPTRRKRTKKENLLSDKNARIRNKEIARKYREFTGEQPVVSITTMTTAEIEAYLDVKYTIYQRQFAKGHAKT